MSELSPDARDLIAHARKHGPELLGPSAEQRVALRAKLSPLWAAEAAQPRASSGWRWKLGSFAVLAGLGVVSWLYTQPAAEQAASSPQSISSPEPVADQAAGAASPTERSAAATALSPHCPSETGACPTEPASAKVDAQPVAATSRKPKRPASARTAEGRALTKPSQPCAALTPSAPSGAVAETSQAQAPTGSRTAADAATAEGALSPISARGAGGRAEAEQQQPGVSAQLGIDPERPQLDLGRHRPRPDRLSHTAASRLPLKAAAVRTPERAVETAADPAPPSIDGELELLGAAQSALQKHRPSRALTLLQEHAFRFPTGAMVEERMAMQALALCALHRRNAAQTVLSNLEARRSQSQLLPRVRSQCGL